jgi:integrase
MTTMTDQMTLPLEPTQTSTTPAETPESSSDAPTDEDAPRPSKPASRLATLTPLPPAERPPTLSGCVAWLGSQLGEIDSEFKQIRGAVRTITKVALKRHAPETEDLPADPAKLREHLRNAMPAAVKVSPSRWHNAKSLLTSLLIAVGWVSPEVRDDRAIDPELAGIMARLTKEKALTTPLRPFLRYCQREGISPAEITAATVEGYEAWLDTHSLVVNPRATAIHVTTSWRRIQRLQPDWPRQELRLASRVLRKAEPPSAFPAFLQTEVQAYLAALRDPDPMDLAQGRPAGEIHVQQARRSLMRAATCLAQSGVPHAEISSIARLVEPDAFRAIARVLHAEGLPLLKARGETAQWTQAAKDICRYLVMAARRWVRVPEATLKELVAMQARIKPRRGGLSDKVQDMLGELLTDEERAALFALPWQGFEVADAMLRAGDIRRGAKLHETCLAFALVLRHPMRARDLARLDLARHFIRDPQGRIREVAIRASKTSASVRFEVGDDLAARLQTHIDRFRPHLADQAASTFLFPSKGGKSRNPQSIGRHIGRLAADQLGKKFYTHAARHLAVDIILDDDPGNLALAQRQLAHRTPKVTGNVYGARATLAANRRYAKLLREQAERAGYPTRKGKRK